MYVHLLHVYRYVYQCIKFAYLHLVYLYIRISDSFVHLYIHLHLVAWYIWNYYSFGAYICYICKHVHTDLLHLYMYVHLVHTSVHTSVRVKYRCMLCIFVCTRYTDVYNALLVHTYNKYICISNICIQMHIYVFHIYMYIHKYIYVKRISMVNIYSFHNDQNNYSSLLL